MAFEVRLVDRPREFSRKLEHYLFPIIATNVLQKIQVFNLEAFNLN